MGNVHLFGHAVGVIGIFSIVDYPMMITNYQQNIPMKKPAYPSAASATTKIPHSTSYINNGRGRNGRALFLWQMAECLKNVFLQVVITKA